MPNIDDGAERVRQLQAEMDAHVSTTIGGEPVTVGELRAAFKKVQNAVHWKNPVDAEIILTEREAAVLEYAVIYLTGSVPSMTRIEGDRWKVQADGYFMAVGS